jgi:glycosyltransferase involved in cell wall biosynthesis
MKKKILFIMHLPPPIHGAAMVGQYIMDSAVLQDSFESTYVNLSTSSNLIDIGKGGLSKILALIKIMKKIVAELIDGNYDLCYMTLTATGAGFYKDLVVVFLLKIFRKNIVYHFHNKGIALASEKKLPDLLYRFVFENTQSILLSKSLYGDLSKFVPEKRIYYCANGIPESRDEVPVALSDPSILPCRLLFLSNMMEEKGVYILLDACRLLVDRGIDFRCDFVGAWSDITEEDFRFKVESMGLTKYVFAHGKKYNAEKNTFLHNAEIFVFPTYYHNECLPLVLLEAMQQGIAIVSTPEGGIADVIINEKTGFLTPQKDVKELTEKLALLIDNPDMRQRVGMAARQSFDKNYTLMHFEKRLNYILKTLTPTLRDIKAAKNDQLIKLSLR